MLTRLFLLLLVTFSTALLSNAQVPVPQSFIDCIGSGGSGNCPLTAGVYLVSNTLQIQRSNFIIQGVAGQPQQVVLRRNANIPRIMNIIGGVTNVQILDLTFDGNRYGFPGGTNLNCLPTNPPYWDLDLSTAGWVTVQYVNFINAPGAALILDQTVVDGVHASTVSYSNFGQGFGSQSAPQTATRATAIFLQGTDSGAYYNNIAYAGTAAITVEGDQLGTSSSQIVYGNILQNNRYEQPDNVSGGQLYVDPTSAYAAVAENTINGNYWLTTGHSPAATGCSVTSGLWSHGIEAGQQGAASVGHGFYNNWITQNLGFGMLVRNLSSVTISGTDPWCGGCAHHFIENNGGCWNLPSPDGPGTCYKSPPWPASLAVAGVNVDDSNGPVSNLTLDQVRVRFNARYGLYLYNVSGGPGFSSPACIYGNTPNGDLSAPGSASGYQSYTLMSPCP